MTHGTVLLGRGAELDRLDRVLDGRAGVPTVVDLVGAAGIGKSRLLTEVCARARDRGLTVLRGRATEYEQHIPFRLFTDAFADLDPESLRAVAAEAEPVGPVLYGVSATAEHGPDAGVGVGSGPGTGWGSDHEPGPGSGPSALAAAGATAEGGAERTGPGARARDRRDTSAPADRFSLHRAVARLLGALGGEHGGGRGLLIALDDLHWADPASLELLDHLVRHPLRAPVTIVVARRDRQTSPSLAAALTRGADTGAVLRLDLGPLDERVCVEHLAPGLPPARAARLYAASEGNPLYFLALLQQQPGPALPTGDLSALLLDELTPLTAAQRRTAEAVAVLGDRATPALLAVVAEAPDAAVLDADLAVLARRDLLRPAPGGSWSLRHPVLRTVVHEHTEHRRRTGMHRRAAAALARAGTSAAARAPHVERALTGWDPELAAVLLEAAGQSETTAPASCAHWLEVVLRVLPDAPGHTERRLDLLLRRARALSVCGELRESRDLLRELIAQTSAGEDDRVRADAVTLCASMERHLGHYGAAVALLRRELDRRPAPRPAAMLALGLELSSSTPHSLDYAEVRGTVERTFHLAERLGDAPAAAGALAISALGEAYGGNVSTALGFIDRAAARVDALADHELADMCEPLSRLSLAEYYLERFEDAERHADRGLTVARRSGPLHIMAHLLLCKAAVHMNTCRLGTALDQADEAESIARGIGSDQLLALALASKAQVLIASLPPGDRTSLTVAEEAVALAGPSTSWWSSLVWYVMSYAALHSGDPVRARAAMLRVGGGPELAGLQPSMRPLLLEALVTAAVTTGDLAAATGWAALAGRDAERLGLPGQRASALRSAGQVLAGRGEPAAAARQYARAAEEAARAGATLWEAQALLIGASLTAQAGDPGAAAGPWERGRGMAEAGGSRLLTGLADLFPPAPAVPRPLATLAPSAAPPPRPADASGPGPHAHTASLSARPAPAPPAPALPGLTPREREIAALVTEGLTTPAIAARLYLSPRTVDTHLSHIFRKTGVASRSALAALAARTTT
ncbi:AAA family ATPase [Streptomyces sp. NPDC098789]|uniref:helix-turn-helix transcriptional regulator n=1 Tax=Streptomyces sp. NPDC098789 TaxID=3366098 RepID=UPI0037F1D154